jgi:predicted transcriptional regulator of viral defense system
MQSIHNQIITIIKKRRKGNIIFANDFKEFGSGDAIRQVLSRLCKEDFIVRLSTGIYLYPKISKQIGMVFPSIEDIAKAIAKREKARLIPTGVYALNRLGLSTQVPMKVVFLTDGAPRVIKVGKKATVKFKKTVAKHLACKGEISTLVIFALKEIGKGNVNESELQRIKEALAYEKQENIRHDATLAPEWISEIMIKLSQNENE